MNYVYSTTPFLAVQPDLFAYILGGLLIAIVWLLATALVGMGTGILNDPLTEQAPTRTPLVTKWYKRVQHYGVWVTIIVLMHRYYTSPEYDPPPNEPVAATLVGMTEDVAKIKTGKHSTGLINRAFVVYQIDGDKIVTFRASMGVAYPEKATIYRSYVKTTN